ncbi:probable calcium-binding protein CML31 [Humulus lupulus]|uniref:probable calcium-binding protein CML31 n=1 Tax=Humulus lupulus TaxID=3486 RepID=UPI002B410435|nr:probable calcium-binding protein CML31 [Humulus lupulus]
MTTSTDLAKDHTKSPLARLRRKLSPKKSTTLLTPSPTIMSMQQQQPLLQRVFDYFDKDGDGKISPAELQSCVRATGGQLSLDEAAAAVDSSDMDGDGLLGYYEFVKLMEGSGEDKVKEEEEKNKELREAFGMYEMGGSGCITPASLRTMLSRLGGSHSLEDCKAMIRTFDLNGDGVLSFDEFSVMMR